MNDHFVAAPAPGQDRDAWLAAMREHRQRVRAGVDLSIYARPEMNWLRTAFTCHFTFMYDSSFYDPDRDEYTVDAFLRDGRETFGGYDAVVLWQGYPRLGVDQRNQFDMYRDMPGGLKRLREVVSQLHHAGVRVFIDYNPWDTGTRRESKPDEEALADLVVAMDVDGIFLDTMSAAPTRLRQTVDRARPGVAFVPEVHPDVKQLALCSGSWAQWLDDATPPGLLHLKWIEPAHMQYQIRRWDLRHNEEIRAAFFNGSGMMIWENVFGAYNPWTPADAALWRRAARILHHFGEQFSSEQWDPFYPTSSPELFAHRWPGKEATLFTLRGVPRRESSGPLSIDVPADGGALAVDLWSGQTIETKPVGNRLRINVKLTEDVGCVAVVRGPQVGDRLRQLLEQQRNEKAIDGIDLRSQLKSTTYAEVIKRTKALPLTAPPAGMVSVAGAAFRMQIIHQRRECGCYLDPGMDVKLGKDFRWGDPHGEQLHHDIQVAVKPFFIDEAEVSNAEYQRFLDATGYQPRQKSNFLAHWENGAMPQGREDYPVVWVDIDDARAYARWAGKRLPTEAEWQLAAQGTDARKWPWGAEFDASRCNGSGQGTLPVRSLPAGRSACGCYHMAGNVWELTESAYDDGHTRFVMLRGGSYFDARTSGWYVRGGAQPGDAHTKLIRMGPSLDRCATVGFRCVADVAE